MILLSKKRVVAAMSGGVDSTLTVKLLQEAGYEVFGATMQLFDGQNLDDAREMADFLGIKHAVIDVRKLYEETVLEYFIDSYKNGITPNPCMMCDFKIKFGVFYDQTRAMFDCDYFATGHYSRIVFSPERQKFEVRKAVDLPKDQSYMMYHLTQEQLSKIIFPLGRICKKDTRRISKEKGLPTYNKAESQDICFLTTEQSYVDFLREEAPEAFKDGPIVNKKGQVLGKHHGIPHYTIGQRKGLGIIAKTPQYVVSIDAKKNRIVVGGNDDLFRTKLLATDLAFTDGKPPAREFKAEGKVRYGMKVHECHVKIQDDGRAVVTFTEPQRAITSGQSVVFYEGDRLIGGGTIIRSL